MKKKLIKLMKDLKNKKKFILIKFKFQKKIIMNFKEKYIHNKELFSPCKLKLTLIKLTRILTLIHYWKNQKKLSIYMHIYIYICIYIYIKITSE